LKSESITFSSEGQYLHGVLTFNKTSKKRGVVLLHPHPIYGGDMDNYVVTSLETLFLEEDFTTLRFNFRGVSSSRGRYSGVNGAVIDTFNAIDYLKSRTEIDEFGIAGYSFGASVAIRVASVLIPNFLVSLSASWNLVLEDSFQIEQLYEISCPTIFFHGLDDKMIPPEDLVRFTKAIDIKSENAIPVEGEGHFYQSKLPYVLSTVQAFIRKFSY
jgi:alpha/beta superfamily hydrolase